jgi:polyisoprenoid-binding protein YceI
VFSAAVIVVVSTTFAAGAESTLNLDPANSRVSFTLKSTLHTVEGVVALNRGVIRFDPDTGEASGEVVFDARRTVTGNEDRDQKMHRKVLESELYPEIVFVPESIVGRVPESGAGAIELGGAVTVHGASHPVVIKVELTRDGDRVHASGSLPIPYVAWGMKNPSVLVLRVAKEVDVALDVEGTVLK